MTTMGRLSRAPPSLSLPFFFGPTTPYGAAQHRAELSHVHLPCVLFFLMQLDGKPHTDELAGADVLLSLLLLLYYFYNTPPSPPSYLYTTTITPPRLDKKPFAKLKTAPLPIRARPACQSMPADPSVKASISLLSSCSSWNLALARAPATHPHLVLMCCCTLPPRAPIFAVLAAPVTSAPNWKYRWDSRVPVVSSSQWAGDTVVAMLPCPPQQDIPSVHHRVNSI